MAESREERLSKQLNCLAISRQIEAVPNLNIRSRLRAMPKYCRVLSRGFLKLSLVLALVGLSGFVSQLFLHFDSDCEPVASKHDKVLIVDGSGPLEPPVPDEAAIERLFPKLLHVAQKHAGRNRDKAVALMARHLPDIDTSGWLLHSPAGRNFTVREVQLMALSSLTAGFQVPNVAHYVLPFRNTRLEFHHMVCLLSCLHVMRPDRLLLWYAPGHLPTGNWWRRLRLNVSDVDWERRVVMIRREPPRRIYTAPVLIQEHQSDVMRLEALLTFGGVYLDLDVLVLKPLEPLRRSACTIGREVSYGLCNGAILSAPGATFLALWHITYQVFSDVTWAEHSVWLPNSLNDAFPSLCHVEEESMQRPNWTPEELVWIYGIGQQHRWDWRRKNYLVHLWFRKHRKQHDLDSIRQLDSMFGEMCRYILFGTGQAL